MRTDQIIYLGEIDRKHSLHQASESLHISTQALSLSIKSLEDELGVLILDRSRTGVKLTDKGKRLLEVGNIFLKSLQEIKDEAIKEYEKILTDDLCILATGGVAETLLPELMSQLYFDYPEFHLKPTAKELNAIPDLLKKDAYEAALIYKVAVNDQLITDYDTDTFTFEPFVSGNYYCMIPENHPIAHYKSISLNTMAEYPIVLFSPSRDVLLKLFSHTKKEANIIFADNFSLFKRLLTNDAGLSLSLVFDNTKAPVVSLPNIKLVPFKEHIFSQFGYIHKSEITLSLKMKAFLKYVREYLDKNGLQNYPPIY